MKIAKSLSYRAARHLAKKPQKASFSRPVISVCFDDFPKSAAEAGAQILSRYGMKGSYYFCADFAGRVLNGVRQYDQSDLARLAADGHEIGCHTASHSAVSQLSQTQIADEIARNARFLNESGVIQPMRTFAFPFGDVNVSSKRCIGRRFAASRGVWAGINSGTLDLSLLKCVCLEDHVLSRKPVTAWIEEAIAKTGWLIFLTHDVSSEPTPYGVTPEALDELAKAAAQAGVDILPVRDALDKIMA